MLRRKVKRSDVCADFSSGLNKALKDYLYPLPSPEESFVKLTGGNFFSKIDSSDAFLQIPVDEQYSKLLCINTHWSLFQLEQLPFGIKFAPTVFQQIMDTMLSGLEFVIAYLDDILIYSQSAEQHKLHVYKVFKRIQDHGFKIKEGKYDFSWKK